MAPRPRFKSLDPEKKAQILESASEEFSEKGYEGASFNRIIENAGISKGAAYYYFDDKSDLFDTVVAHLMQKLAIVAGNFTMDDLTQENFWGRLETYSVDSLITLQTNAWARRVANMFFRWSNGDSKTSRAMWSYCRRYTREFLERGQQLGHVRTDIPMDLLIEMVIGLGFATDRWLFDRIDDIERDELERTGRLIMSVYRDFLDPKKDAT